MRFVDSLAHLDDARIENIEPLLRRARAAGVGDIILGGFCSSRDILEAQNASPHSPRLWRALGVHPQAVDMQHLDEQLAVLSSRCAATRVIAIGETGLDRRPGMPPCSEQRRAFLMQLDLADTLKIPVIIHCVQATGALLEIISTRSKPKAGCMLHGFSGPKEVLPQLLDWGAYISFGGLVSYSTAKKCHQAARAVPAHRLLLESDTPEHAPNGWPHRQSEPASLPHTLQALATLRGDEPEQLALQIAANSHALFKLS